MSPGRRSLVPTRRPLWLPPPGKDSTVWGRGVRKALSTVSGSKSLMVFLELVTP